MDWENRFESRVTSKQKVWDYIRRKGTFIVEEMMMVLDIKRDFLMPIFRALELAGYIELETGSDEFIDRRYRLLKNTGPKSPIVLKRPCDIVKDKNTKEEFILDGSDPIQIADRLNLLYAMRHQSMFREQIAVIAKIHPYSAKTFRYLNEFAESGIMERLPRSPKIREERRTYAINKEKRDDLIRALEESLRPVRSA